MPSMDNKFAAVMARETDEELIRIVTILKNDYQPLAILAAEEEIRKRSIDPAKVEEVKTVLTEEIGDKQYIEAIEAGSLRRLVHFVIDTPAALLVSVIIFFWLNLASGLLELSFNIPLMSSGIVLLLYYTVFLGSYLGYYIFMEHYFQKTLGKYLTKTTVVMADGKKAELNDVVKRAFCRIIPFDALSYLFSPRGLHDRLSDTRVIRDEAELPD